MVKSDRHYYFGKSKEKLFVQEWGPQDKPVILLVHGFPGCSDHGKLMSKSPLWNSFRLIAMDRPGYGRSVAQNRLTPLRFAQQIENLLTSLEIDRFSLISVSGGAPYSMAVAYRMKDRIQKIASIGGVAPLTIKNFKFMNSQQKKAWFLRNFVPAPILKVGVHRVWKTGMQNLEKLFFTDKNSFSAEDQKVFRDPVLGPELYQTMVTALSGGPSGLLMDMKTYSRPWGFSLKAIKCPVTLWHGTDDDVVHSRFAEDMQRKLPDAKLHFIEKQGHYSLLLHCRDAIIADVLSQKSAVVRSADRHHFNSFEI
jgi:pimeloyl-ACP methyl ester carboxylesterase